MQQKVKYLSRLVHFCAVCACMRRQSVEASFPSVFCYSSAPQEQPNNHSCNLPVTQSLSSSPRKTQTRSHLQGWFPQLRLKRLWFHVFGLSSWCLHRLLLWGNCCMTYRSLKCFLPSYPPLPLEQFPVILWTCISTKWIKQRERDSLLLSHVHVWMYIFSFAFIFHPWECFFLCADVTSSQDSTLKRRLKWSWLPSPLCTLAEGYHAQPEAYLPAQPRGRCESSEYLEMNMIMTKPLHLFFINKSISVSLVHWRHIACMLKITNNLWQSKTNKPQVKRLLSALWAWTWMEVSPPAAPQNCLPYSIFTTSSLISFILVETSCFRNQQAILSAFPCRRGSPSP